MITKTACPYCGVGCGVLATPKGAVKGDPSHPANAGRLCSKGTQLGQTIGPEGRLLQPRIGGHTASWTAALELVAEKFTAAIAEHGPDSVAFYVSGQLLTEDYYAANKLMKGYIGSANIDTNSRLCMASSVAGHKRAFGTDTVPGCYDDIDLADLVVLVGSNLAWCHPVLYQRLVAAKKAWPAMRVVTIDPRRTATADIADMHLAVAPDGDVALFNAVLARLARDGQVDEDFIRNHVNGFDAALAAAQTPDDCGLRDDEIDAFTSLWASTEKVVTVYSQGLNQSRCGTDKVNAILNCHLASGRIGKPGMGPFSVTGQPNAMGGREVGGLANMLANHLDIENPDHRAALQAVWQSPTMCTQPGLKAVDLFRACGEGKIKALWVMSTNPAVSLPDADRVAEAIKAVPFVVVSDMLERTDTGDLADVVLPAAPWGEKSGTVTNSERVISRQRAFLPVMGEARPDWQIIAGVARYMGWGNAFDWASPAEVFREYAASTALGSRFQRDFDISGLAELSDDAYDALEPVQWPCRPNEAPGGRFFGDGRFYHPDGKAKMLAVTPPALPAVDPAYPFVLNSGRIRDQWHTMTRTGLSPRLSQHIGEPFVEVHPEDALRLGLSHADLAEVSTPEGKALLRVRITPSLRRGTVFVPMHWTRQNAPAGRVGPMIAAVTDPVSGQPALKGSRAALRRCSTAWFGFAASAKPLAGDTLYAAHRRTETGHAVELAGATVPADWQALFNDLIGPDWQVVSVDDPASGLIRMAAYDGPRLRALFFAAPEPVAVSRKHAIAAIGTEAAALQVLAGRPGDGMADPGPTLCACLDVGINTVRAAIAAGALDVDSIGKQTGAGTNCGSCKPELMALIREMTRDAAE